MLILSRRQNESLLIESSDGVIELVVTEITPGQVRLGIQAPQTCKILRKELAQTMQHNRMAAAKPPRTDLRSAISNLKNQE
ncbi:MULTISPECIES: carbon storage regulator [Caproicibacterium]|uniref:Translational regulator CsrA n=1 Tax=Caproicibacterium argilliputei TaxID=3030016 RepID=A0AA97D7W2_9FIRM|nr:carbon storage regulator [Caproicibacterium argilliputei]WOC31284.1 carbon storage regulator [Caproicibacterium argilliputei]